MPELVLELNGQSWTLDPQHSYVIGRDPQSSIVVEDSRVSWHHATISFDGGSWVLTDSGSTNGSYLGGQRTETVRIAHGSAVNLGNAVDGPRLAFTLPGAVAAAEPVAQPVGAAGMAGGGPAAGAPPVQSAGAAGYPAGGQDAPAGRSPSMIMNVGRSKVTRIGRALDNDLVVTDLVASRHHAELRPRHDGRFEIVDLDSHNGTYVNGQPVSVHVLGPADTVGIGHSMFRLAGDRLEEFIDTGEVSLSARSLTLQVKHKGQTKTLLDKVSFAVPEKSLTAVIGPSGSGKSTVLKALNGYQPAQQGDVLYDNRNLYKQFAELRQRIGMVPQDDILHPQLEVRTALRYAAKLRFPQDTEAAEREGRIEEVLEELRLTRHADKVISSLSGGQRKRVSVALELLTKPSLLFLDEPTSGLDPGMDRDVMQTLRGLADDGRTVMVVTHSMYNLNLCDRLLVMAPGGKVAYFGPPEEALHFFGRDDWPDVFRDFEEYPEYDWADRFRGSVHYQTYSADQDNASPQSIQLQVDQVKPPKQQGWFSQLGTLMRRYLSVIAADKGYIGLLIALPVIMGIMSMAIPAKYGLGVPHPALDPKTHQPNFNADAQTVLLVLAVGACLTGAANAVRELIKERVIYSRERSTGLSRSAYMMSKIIVLGGITALQSIVLAAIGLSTRKLPAHGLLISSVPIVEMVLVVMFLGLTSMMLGLVISALVKTSEKTMPLLVLIAIVQVVFTGSLFPLFNTPGLNQVSWLSPSRWAVAAEAATINLTKMMPPPISGHPGKNDPLWKHTLGTWALDCGVLIGLGLICALLVVRLLRRHEPEIMRKG